MQVLINIKTTRLHVSRVLRDIIALLDLLHQLYVQLAHSVWQAQKLILNVRLGSLCQILEPLLAVYHVLQVIIALPWGFLPQLYFVQQVTCAHRQLM